MHTEDKEIRVLVVTSQYVRVENGKVLVSANTYDILKRFLYIGPLSIIGRTYHGKAATNIDKEISEISPLNVRLISKSHIFVPNKYKRLIDETIQNNDLIIGYVPDLNAEYGANAAKRYHKKYLSYVVGCTWDMLWNHSPKGKAIAPLAYFSLKRTLKKSDYALYVSQKFLQKRYPTNGLQIGIGDVRITDHGDYILKNRLNKISKTNLSERITLCTIGAVYVRYKGQQYVIEALGKLKQMGDTRFHYYLIGGGSQDYLLSVAKRWDVEEQVHFMGIMPHSEIFAFMDSMDVCIHPSLTEGFSRCIVEAMSRATPCIATRAGAIPELLPNECLFTAKSPDEIVEVQNNIDKEYLTRNAERNCLNSDSYTELNLDKIRHQFFDKIKASIFN